MHVQNVIPLAVEHETTQRSKTHAELIQVDELKPFLASHHFQILT